MIVVEIGAPCSRSPVDSDPSSPPISVCRYLVISPRHCGIQKDDVIRVSNLSDNRKFLHLPGYMVAVDHASRSVVLSVRGTFSVQNTLTDLVCDSTGECLSLRFSTPCVRSAFLGGGGDLGAGFHVPYVCKTGTYISYFAIYLFFSHLK